MVVPACHVATIATTTVLSLSAFQGDHMGSGGNLYKFVYLLHLITIVVGFGSSFVYPMLAAKARGLSPKEAYAVNHSAFSVSKYLTSYPIYAAGFFGLCLIPLSEGQWTFKQTWVSLALLLYIIALACALFLHLPNLKAMDALAEKMSKTAPSKTGPPKQLAELQERGQRAAMYGGLMHLLWLLLMIDMVFKPFLDPLAF